MSNYKIYTYGAKGNKILLCKSEDYMSARYLMEAMCNQYPQWPLELCLARNDKSEKIAWRNAESKQIKEYVCGVTGNICPHKPTAYGEYPCETCEYGKTRYNKKSKESD